MKKDSYFDYIEKDKLEEFAVDAIEKSVCCGNNPITAKKEDNNITVHYGDIRTIVMDEFGVETDRFCETSLRFVEAMLSHLPEEERKDYLTDVRYNASLFGAKRLEDISINANQNCAKQIIEILKKRDEKISIATKECKYNEKQAKKAFDNFEQTYVLDDGMETK